MNVRWFILLALIATGCGRGPAPVPQAPVSPSLPATNEPPKSAVSTVVDGLTGKTAIDAGQRARLQLDNVRTQENSAINEAMQ